MKILIPVLLSIVIVLAGSCREKTTREFPSKGSMLFFDTATGKYKIFSADKSLINTWESFTAALLKHDYVTVKSMLCDCITCPNCSIGTDHLIWWSADEFYDNHFDKIFNSSFLSYMSDSSNVRGHYDERGIYSEDTCVLNCSGINNPKVVQIFVSFPLRKGEYEGSMALLDFIETKSGYKFCGYSTIP